MLNVSPHSFVTLRAARVKGNNGTRFDAQPRAAYLVDLVAAIAGINTSDAQKALIALQWLDRSGQIVRIEDSGAITDAMPDRLTLSRWAMIQLLQHTPRDAKHEEIRQRLARLYEKHGNIAEATAITAG